ncbi:hypothetical protein MMSP_2046 [Mycobacterium sp. 012931]|nr:hypothetical protein MMSP_2046 [Mycobacterium sp. 012931]
MPVRPDVTAKNAAAAERNSAANPVQAVAAASTGPGPAPLNNRAELISGGSTAKFIRHPVRGRPEPSQWPD